MAGLEQVEDTTPIVTQAKYEMYRHWGYSPAMWGLGSMGPKMPGSLLREDMAHDFAVQEAAAYPSSRMEMKLARREAARVALIRMDNDNRYRTALLRKARPSRGFYPIHRWFRPAARVLSTGGSVGTVQGGA